MSEEPEDYNAFGKWDSVGAAAMLGCFPAVLCYVFNDHDLPATLSWLSLSVVAALVVFLLGYILPGKMLGRVVNMIGWVLTGVYLIIAVVMWNEAVERDFHSGPGEVQTPQADS